MRSILLSNPGIRRHRDARACCFGSVIAVEWHGRLARPFRRNFVRPGRLETKTQKTSWRIRVCVRRPRLSQAAQRMLDA